MQNLPAIVQYQQKQNTVSLLQQWDSILSLVSPTALSCNAKSREARKETHPLMAPRVVGLSCCLLQLSIAPYVSATKGAPADVCFSLTWSTSPRSDASATLPENVVALKSIAAYRCGLDIIPSVDPAEAEAGLQATLGTPGMLRPLGYATAEFVSLSVARQRHDMISGQTRPSSSDALQLPCSFSFFLLASLPSAFVSLSWHGLLPEYAASRTPEGSLRLMDRHFISFLISLALELAHLHDIPLQMHTG